MAVHDDYAGVAFTIMNILLNHAESLPDIEFLLVDNNPGTGESNDAKKFMLSKIPNGRYTAISPYTGSFVKNQVIQAANTEYVLCIDSHVMLAAGSIRKLIAFLRAVGITNDLFHGPILTERGTIHATHMNPGFSGGNFGRWGTYQGDEMKNPDIYQVPLHGMGLFLTRRDTWPGFHTAMHQFGSEEGYIHEKFRLLGRDCWSLPFLGWWHLFRNESRNISYPLSNPHKYRNSLIAWTEINLPLDFVDKCFETILSPEQRSAIKMQVASLGIVPMARDKFKPAFLGYPLRILDAPVSQSEYYTEFEKPIFYNRA